MIPSLQIRDVPAPTQRLAILNKRSLSQRAMVDLEVLAGGDPHQRRQEALERIAEHWRGHEALKWPQSPEDLIRADRER